MSLDGLFSSDAGWGSPIGMPFSAFMNPDAEQKSTTDPGAWAAGAQYSLNNKVALLGAPGAIIDVASLHSFKAGDLISYRDANGVTQSHAMDHDNPSPYMTPDVSVGGNITVYGNAHLFDDLIMPSLPSHPDSVLDAAIAELLGVQGAMDSLGSALTSVGFETGGAMKEGVTNAPAVDTGAVAVSAGALQDAFDAALKEIGSSHLGELWPTSMPSDVFSVTAIACTDTTIASIPDLATAAVAAQQAAARDDEDVEAQRLADSFQNLRGSAFGTGFDTAMARFRERGVRARAADAARMHMESLNARATAAMKQAELTAQSKATALEAARITLEAQQAKASMKYQEMVSRIQAVLTIGKEISDATVAAAQLSAQVGIALAAEYTRNFGMGFSHIGTKADVLGKLCQLRNLKVEHELRDKLWNVELFPYWAGAMGAPGAATVKKPSAFDTFTNAVGGLANAGSAALNIYSAIK